jgi:predicted nucleic acid-binding protein
LGPYVLDTSAVMAVLLGEPGAETTRDTIIGNEDVLLPFVALMEVEYKLTRHSRDAADKGLEAVASWPVEVVESNPPWRSEAARVKAGGNVSLADAWVAALALLKDAELVHKDPEFDSIPNLKHLRLPYKPKDRLGRDKTHG